MEKQVKMTIFFTNFVLENSKRAPVFVLTRTI